MQKLASTLPNTIPLWSVRRWWNAWASAYSRDRWHWQIQKQKSLIAFAGIDSHADQSGQVDNKQKQLPNMALPHCKKHSSKWWPWFRKTASMISPSIHILIKSVQKTTHIEFIWLPLQTNLGVSTTQESKNALSTLEVAERVYKKFEITILNFLYVNNVPSV